MATLPSGYAAAGVAPKGVLSPDMALRQAQLQRRLAIAQMLQQQSLSPADTGQGNNMPVVPRVGLAPALSKVAQALIAKKVYGDATDEQQSIAQQQYDAARQAVLSVPGVDGGQASGVAGAASGALGTGLPANVAMQWSQQDPNGFYKWAGENAQPTEAVKTAQLQGRDLGQMGQLATAKDTVQATQTFHPGDTNIVPGVQQPFVAADFGKGTTGGYDQQGNPVLAPIAGAQSTLANLAGAQQAATSANTILPNVTMSNGATAPMWAGQAAGGQAPPGFGGQIQAESGGNQGAVSPAGARGVAQLMPAMAREYEKKMGFAPGSSDTDPQVNAAIGARYMSEMTDKYTKLAGGDQAAGTALARMAYNAGPGRMDDWIKGGMDPSALPQETQDYNGRVNAANGGLPAPVPKSSGPVGIGQSTQDKAIAEKRAGNVADLEQDINDKAASSQLKLANNKKLLEILPSVTTGPVAEQLAKGKNLLHQMGWSGADPSNFQELQKIMQQSALESAKQVYGNRITNADLMTLPMWTPSASMADNALRVIVGMDNIQQQRNLQKQTVYNEYRNQGGDLNQFPSYFNQNYPNQGISAPTSVTPGAQAPISQASATKIYRYDPKTGKLEAQ